MQYNPQIEKSFHYCHHQCAWAGPWKGCQLSVDILFIRGKICWSIIDAGHADVHFLSNALNCTSTVASRRSDRDVPGISETNCLTPVSICSAQYIDSWNVPVIKSIDVLNRPDTLPLERKKLSEELIRRAYSYISQLFFNFGADAGYLNIDVPVSSLLTFLTERQGSGRTSLPLLGFQLSLTWQNLRAFLARPSYCWGHIRLWLPIFTGNWIQ
jgi:hypothetical protein